MCQVLTSSEEALNISQLSVCDPQANSAGQQQQDIIQRWEILTQEDYQL